ncbi:23S rRNA (guanosine(2251)-2'-O)-methyltransferase RlmB [Chrysiogenes arsenatis]|uniref:23S rRNA (guanosine(2251)-2'-O)-methyltransferase RlmB n=1 Tax=Chrysiogenes arsenatis TaxID=309797 RepID=UPI000412D7FB|nr:23S rRNA (guanosine(2251)-2'-O)-methyltransferase RlmB [Chrysiogenes arsenatis]
MKIKGLNNVMAALRESSVEKVFCSRNVEELTAACKAINVPCKVLPRVKIDELFGDNHQGVGAFIAEIPQMHPADILKQASRLVIVDRVQDPGNLGALIRSAAAFGAAVVMSEHETAPLSDVVAKASAGMIHHVPLARVANLTRFVEQAKAAGFWILCLDMGGKPLASLKLDGKIGLIIGNEGTGVKPILKQNADFTGRIPMAPKVESLNAAMATSIALYELERQWPHADLPT